MILPYQEHTPDIHPNVFVADGAVITGHVKIGSYSNIWYNAVLRGDVSSILIGQRVSIQDNATLHESPQKPLILEDDVIVGHNAILHSCHIHQGALIGMGAIVLDGAEIGAYAMLAAGSLVPPGKKIPPRCVAIGSPARVIRELNETDERELTRICESYVVKGQEYRQIEKNKQTENDQRIN